MLEDFSLIEIAKLESAITGIFAGFALTIIVLLIERFADKSSTSKRDVALGKAAITVFVAAFFTSTLASFLFTASAGEEKISTRLFLLIMMPGFVFSLSSILLAQGLVFLLGAYKLAYALKPAQAILGVTILLSLFNYSYSALELISVMSKASLIALLSQPKVIVPLAMTPVVSLVLGFFLRRYLLNTEKDNFHLKWFQEFILSCIVTCTIVAIVQPFISAAPPDVFVPSWLSFLFVLGLSIVSGWSVLYIPRVA